MVTLFTHATQGTPASIYYNHKVMHHKNVAWPYPLPTKEGHI